MAQGRDGGVPAAGPVHATARVCRGAGEVQAGNRGLGPPQTSGRPQDELLVERSGAGVEGTPAQAGVTGLQVTGGLHLERALVLT